MKVRITIILLLIAAAAFPQSSKTNYSFIDWQVKSVKASSPEILAQRLAALGKTDKEKVRAIFKWITDNISYGTPKYADRRRTFLPAYNEAEDTGKLKPLNERVAEIVLRKRMAVCDGYARLFKTLCDYAGLQSEIVTGYARGNGDYSNNRFRSNHSWNAVFIDSAWQLLDVTWASGFMTYHGNEFVKYFDDSYFLSSPEYFIKDHYPENPDWTLLKNPPLMKEFNNTPFKHSSFIKHRISAFQPLNGIIQAKVGDTVLVELETTEQINNHIDQISLPEFSIARPASWAFIKPVLNIPGKKVSYTYAVESSEIEWLCIVYNDDVVMRYKLNVSNH